MSQSFLINPTYLSKIITFYLLRFYLNTENKKLIWKDSFEKEKNKDLDYLFVYFSKCIDLIVEVIEEINEIIDSRLITNKLGDLMKEKIIDTSLNLENPNVQSVIAIAEDMMNQNKILTIDRLYNVSKKILKIPRPALISIIQYLINHNVLIEGSKFSRETVLNNYFRKKILDFIRLNGGAHFSILKKRTYSAQNETLGSPGQLLWHLEMLMKFNYIKKIKVGNYTVFLPIEMEPEVGIINFLLRDEINRKIVGLLLNFGSKKNSEIPKSIDENRGKVSYRLQILIDHDIIHKEDSSNQVYLIPDKEEIIRNLLKKFKINDKNTD